MKVAKTLVLEYLEQELLKNDKQGLETKVIAAALGIASAVNFIFLFMIFLLLVNQFQLTVRLSKLDTKFKNLVQILALKGIKNDDRK